MLIACSQKSENNKNEPKTNVAALDQKPGYKSILLGKTINELEPFIEEINSKSGLALTDSSSLKEKSAKNIIFRLDKLQSVGEYSINFIDGIAYNDTLYNLRIMADGYKNIEGFRQILTKIYGKGTQKENPVFEKLVVWENNNIRLLYTIMENNDERWASIVFDDKEFIKRVDKKLDVEISKETLEKF